MIEIDLILYIKIAGCISILYMVSLNDISYAKLGRIQNHTTTNTLQATNICFWQAHSTARSWTDLLCPRLGRRSTPSKAYLLILDKVYQQTIFTDLLHLEKVH